MLTVKAPENYSMFDFAFGHKTKDGKVTKAERTGKDARHPGAYMFYIEFDEPKPGLPGLGPVQGRWAYGPEVELE